MSTDLPRGRKLSLLGYALLLAFGLAGLWEATAVVVPSAEYFRKPFGTQIPNYFEFGFLIQRICYHAIYPVAFIGAALVIIGLLGRGPAWLISTCRTALAALAGVVACLSIYLLGSGGVAYKLVSMDQHAETKYYKRTLEQFALLESAPGRFEKLREAFQKNRDLKMVEVRNAAEFNDAEARERISSLIATLSKTTDISMKRQLLATLSLFRERIPKDSMSAREIPRHAMEAGAPSAESHAEALEWIAANIGKDGWDPSPLFKLGR